jgi:hypothetical protein
MPGHVKSSLYFRVDLSSDPDEAIADGCDGLYVSGFALSTEIVEDLLYWAREVLADVPSQGYESMDHLREAVKAFEEED